MISAAQQSAAHTVFGLAQTAHASRDESSPPGASRRAVVCTRTQRVVPGGGYRSDDFVGLERRLPHDFEEAIARPRRPAVSTERLSLTAQGNIRYRLKPPYRDAITDEVFEPLELVARLAALVPTPRVNLSCYHGVFAPNHRLGETTWRCDRFRESKALVS